MNQPSAFQLQYPLSPRKFWKKMLGKSPLNIGWAVAIGLFTFMPTILVVGGTTNSSSDLLFTIIAIFLVAFLILTIISAIYYKVYIKRYYYDCGEQFITIKKKVFGPTEIHVQYQKIQDVYVDQDIIDRIMGLYDVHIASATITSGIEAHIDGVNADVAESLKNIILAKIHGATNAPANTYQAPTQQPPQQQSNPVQFSQKISSETYPISEKWIWSVIINAIFSALILTVFFGLIILGMAKGLNPNIPFWFILLFCVMFLWQIIYTSIWKKNFYFEFLSDYILLRTGVISKQENHLPYKSIQNVLNAQGIVDRMLGLSKVTIQNAATQMVGKTTQGSGISLPWQPVNKAQELNAILNDIVSKINPQNPNNMMGL